MNTSQSSWWVGGRRARIILLVTLLAKVVQPASAQVYTYLTNFARTANLQINLETNFPAGLYVASNGLATPFDFTTNAAGKNFYELYYNNPPLVISNINLPNVTAVYSVMNAYTPTAGNLATVEFIGNGGAAQTFTLVGNVDLRDFFNGSWDNLINGTTSQLIYEIDGVVGGAATGDSLTGDYGNYRLDEQQYSLNAALQSQWLQTIVFSNVNSSSTPIVAALTAQQGGAGLPFSETFTNATFKPGWTFYTGNSSSSNVLDGSALNIVASYANGGSDLYGGTEYSAPRLLQPVNPGLDWIIETRFSFSPANNYQGAGLLLANGNGAFYADSSYWRVAERAYYPNAGGPVIRSVGEYAAFPGSESWMRVQKVGTNYTGWYSADGVNWTSNGTTSVSSPYSYAGVFVIRYPWDGASVDSTAAFDYFNITLLPPTLTVQSLSTTNLLLTWPGTASIYAVQQSATPSGGWSFAPGLVFGTNGLNALVVPNSEAEQFFRLAYP